MKSLACLFSLLALTNGQCVEGWQNTVELFIVFDQSSQMEQMIETRSYWSAAIRDVAEWVTKPPSSALMYASYSRTVEMDMKQCWVLDMEFMSSDQVTIPMNNDTALEHWGGYHLTWNAASSWLHQGFWAGTSHRRRILFVVTPKGPRTDRTNYVKFSSEALKNPTLMCPLSRLPSPPQHIWSLKKASVGVLLISYPHSVDPFDPYADAVEFYNKYNFTDVIVLPRPKTVQSIIFDTSDAIKRLGCPSWTRTTTPLPPCTNEEEVTQCLLNVDRTATEFSWKYAMLNECFFPSCFSWDKSADCIQQIDPQNTCNWVQTLFDCITH